MKKLGNAFHWLAGLVLAAGLVVAFATQGPIPEITWWIAFPTMLTGAFFLGIDEQRQRAHRYR